MNKRKGFILGGALLASAAALCALAYGSGAFRKNALGTQAVAYNTLDFDMRIEKDGEGDPYYQYTKSYGDEGLVLNVTGGDNVDWHFGIANWDFPTPLGEDADYYCEFVMHVDVAGSEASGASGSEVVLEAGKGDNVYKKDFAADSTFTISKAFKAKGATTGIVLSLGALKNAGGNNVFNACIEKFVLKQGGADGAIVNRINFQNANGFTTKWKASHDASFCASKAGVEELIYDFCALRPAERALITGDFQNLTGKVINEPAGEASSEMKSNAWVAGGGNEAHAEVSVKSTEAWHSRIWIDLSHLGLAAGKTYKLSFDIWKKNEAGFELITQPLKWTNDVNDRYGFFNTTGYHEQEITIPSGGSLWFLAQLGNVVNEISVYNIAVRSLELDVDGKSSIIESVRYFANRYNIELGA